MDRVPAESALHRQFGDMRAHIIRYWFPVPRGNRAVRRAPERRWFMGQFASMRFTNNRIFGKRYPEYLIDFFCDRVCRRRFPIGNQDIDHVFGPDFRSRHLITLLHNLAGFLYFINDLFRFFERGQQIVNQSLLLRDNHIAVFNVVMRRKQATEDIKQFVLGIAPLGHDKPPSEKVSPAHGGALGSSFGERTADATDLTVSGLQAETRNDMLRQTCAAWQATITASPPSSNPRW
jgi:hypothetical protein